MITSRTRHKKYSICEADVTQKRMSHHACMKWFILFLCVDIRLNSRMLYYLMEVLGDNIQRDEAKRNRAEEEIK